MDWTIYLATNLVVWIIIIRSSLNTWICVLASETKESHSIRTWLHVASCQLDAPQGPPPLRHYTDC